MAKYTCRQNNILQPIRGGGMHLGGSRFFYFLGAGWGMLDFCCSHCVPIKFPSSQWTSQHVPNSSSFLKLVFNFFLRKQWALLIDHGEHDQQCPSQKKKNWTWGGGGVSHTRSHTRKIGTSISVYFILFCLMDPTSEVPLHSVRAWYRQKDR